MRTEDQYNKKKDGQIILCKTNSEINKYIHVYNELSHKLPNLNLTFFVIKYTSRDIYTCLCETAATVEMALTLLINTVIYLDSATSTA